MQIDTLKKSYYQLIQAIIEGDLVFVFQKIDLHINESGREFFKDALEKYKQTYNNILIHSFGDYKDPQREQVYIHLKRDLLELTDQLFEFIFTDKNLGNYYAVKNQLERNQRKERKEAIQYLEILTFNSELSDLLKGINTQSTEGEISREEALTKIFNIIWLSDKYSESENELLNAVCESKTLPWHDKCLIVSSITLSLMRYFDVNKFNILVHFVKIKEEFVWERALIGLFLGFLKYQNRYEFYPGLKNLMKELKDIDQIEKHLEAILIQFTKTRETERVTKKWKEDILPQMSKLRPKIEQKMDLENIFKDEFGEEKNPDWETFFEDAPDLLDKLQEFTEMQMEGMDVFISAFAQLKNYPFFHKISNWFVPYYHNNPSIRNYLNISPGTSESNLTPLAKRLEETYFMCNSDKYSFSINLGMIPAEQREALMKMTSAEMDNISEIEKGEGLINQFAKIKSIYTQYLQDLYRFFKLHPWKKEFEDVFSFEPDIFENPFISDLISDNKIVRNIAEFYFDKGFYTYALQIFMDLLERDRSNIELFEKIAFCYEKTGDFKNALDYYQRADLIDSDKHWIIKKMALCSKNLQDWEKALRYYMVAEKQKPDDLRIQSHIGQCLIYLERYKEALDYYFKIEVLAPDNEKIRRPLSWCSFILGKFDIARDYLLRLLDEDQKNPHDLMNMAHTLFCMKEEKQAVEYYKKSAKAFEKFEKFEKSYLDDSKHLSNHGINQTDLKLMLEYIKLNP